MGPGLQTTNNGTLQIGIGGNTAGTGYSQLEVSGPLSLGGTLQLSQLNNFVPEVGDTFLIVQEDTAGPVSGTFSMLPPGTKIMVPGMNQFNQPITTTYQIEYNGGQFGNGVILTNLTSPTTVASTISQVEVPRGATAVNIGTWGDGRAADAVTLKASIGTIVQSGTNANGAWGWFYPTGSASPGSQQVTITADDGHGGVSTTMFTLTIDKDGSTTALTSSPNPVPVGQAVTFTATVTANAPGSGIPSGTVQFSGAGFPFNPGVATLDGTGKATFSATALQAGSQVITATYSGDSTFTPSTGNDSASPEVVSQGNTSTVLKSFAQSPVFGQQVIFTAAVSAVAPAAGSPDGTVTFMDGTTTLGTGTVGGGGRATFGTASLSVTGSPHTITATYNGSVSYIGSTSGSVSETVSKASTIGVVSSNTNPSVFGNTLTFTGSVRVLSPGSGFPTGTIIFLDGSHILSSQTLNAIAHATFSTSSLAVGKHIITVVYSGDGNFIKSGSIGYPQTVNTSGAPALVGDDVLALATARSLAGSSLPTANALLPDRPLAGPVTAATAQRNTVTATGILTSDRATAADAFFVQAQARLRLGGLPENWFNVLDDGNDLDSLNF